MWSNCRLKQPNGSLQLMFLVCPARRDGPAKAGPYILLATLVIAACNAPPSTTPPPTTPAGPVVKREAFGTVAGRPVEQLTLTNKNGIEVRAITYGGIITSIKTPDRAGAMGDIVLGFDSIDGYLGGHPYFGAIVGRYGNRIAKGRFTIDAQEYTLATNNGPNHLHGGIKGLDKQIWSAEILPAMAGQSSVALTYTSADGEEGYPGKLDRRGHIHAQRQATSSSSITWRGPARRRTST